MMIGVARPTRGLEFSESSQSIDRNLYGFSHAIERTWDRAIPDSFNYLVALLLRLYSPDFIWIVEEDVVVPQGGFAALLEADSDIAALDYPLKRQAGVSSSKHDKSGNIIWLSTGCMLIRRRVFDSLEPPWFRSGYTTGSVHEGSSCKAKRLVLLETDFPYGGQDVYFSWMAREAGFKLVAVDKVVAGHLNLEALGASDANAGCHKITIVKPRS